MPLYDFVCDECGPFRHWASMAKSGEPAPCPACERISARSIAAPHMRTGGAVARYKADAHNERNANEPQVVKHVGRKNADKEKHGHAQHSHHGPHSHGKARRPWMVGH